MNTPPQAGQGAFPPPLLRQAEEVLRLARQQGLVVASAESCTGGLVAACLSEIAGASDVLACGFVVYSNEAKQRLLGVPGALVRQAGAVSREVAEAMAECAVQRGGVDAAVAVTGIAGPGGGTAAKPVGLVHFAALRRDGASVHRERRFGAGSRQEIRLASVGEALSLLHGVLAPPA